MSERGSRDRRLAQPSSQLPLIDRLIDEEPDKPRDPPMSPAESLDALRRSVRRDLEALLNTRRRWRSWPEGYAELAVSPVGYGICGFFRRRLQRSGRARMAALEIEQTIRRFEPRLVRLASN